MYILTHTKCQTLSRIAFCSLNKGFDTPKESVMPFLAEFIIYNHIPTPPETLVQTYTTHTVHLDTHIYMHSAPGDQYKKQRQKRRLWPASHPTSDPALTSSVKVTDY